MKKALKVVGYWLSRTKLLFKRYFGIPMIIFVVLLLSGLVIGITGCVVRTYEVTKDRLDQNLETGNRGYLKGQAPQAQERKAKRTIRAVEIELHSPIKFEKMPKSEPIQEPLMKSREEETTGNRGYIMQSNIPEVAESQQKATEATNVQKYTVQKGDTLQKISQKFYGTTKKWMQISEANKDTLKTADKIYPGQIINIPLPSLKETEENLK